MPSRAPQYRPKGDAGRRPSPAEETRGDRHERGYTSQWSRFAKAYLREHPLCRTCQSASRVEAATCVDHIDMTGPLGERGYDPTNLQPLCTRCHNRKTARERHAATAG